VQECPPAARMVNEEFGPSATRIYNVFLLDSLERV